MKKDITFKVDVTGWKVYPILFFTLIGFLDFIASVVIGGYKFIKFIIS